jgi:hypothetical protein
VRVRQNDWLIDRAFWLGHSITNGIEPPFETPVDPKTSPADVEVNPSSLRL